MITNRYEISEIRLTGPQVTDAFVIFHSGLNVISGASDTGKSYIYQCLYFMFGGSSRPKSLQAEDDGYESVYMQIVSESKGTFTLKRDLEKSSYFVWNTDLAHAITSHQYEVYHLTSQNHRKTISSFFLSLQNSSSVDLLLKKNARGTLQRLTISALKQFLMVNEIKIISDDSVFFNKGYSVTAFELSAFRTLVTGLDDRESEEVEAPEVSKAKVSGKIEYLEHLVARFAERVDKQKSEVQDLNIPEIEKKILALREIALNNITRVNELASVRDERWGILQQEKSKQILNSELLDRLKLLKQSLDDDVRRLSFVQESNHYYLQLEVTNCPTCDSPMKLDETVSLEVVRACTIEKGKITRKLDDLNVTLESLENELNNSASRIKVIQNELEEINLTIKNQFGPKVSITMQELEDCENKVSMVRQLDFLIGDLSSYSAELEYFRGMTSKASRTSDYDNGFENALIDQICIEFKEVLSAWKYGNSDTVTYQSDVHDFKIGKKSRLSFGKGHRALLFSAFLIAVLNYSIKTKVNTLHPGILILDSPLTSYKEADKETPTEDDLIPKTTEVLFFEYLSKLNLAQIIVFDNKEPEGIEPSKAHIVHFSRNSAQGRYGFFPVKKLSG